MSNLSDLFKKAETAHHRAPASSVRARVPHIVWSDQQERFLKSTAPQMVLSALAGSGKSTLLMEYAKRRPHQKWNFIVFNRSVADQWSARAPKNVSVQTVHQLAYSRFGASLSHKIQDIQLPDLLTLEMMRRFPSNLHKPYAKLLLSGITNYCLSDDLLPSLKHLPSWDLFCQKYHSQSWDDQEVLSDLSCLWSLMLDERSDVPMTHDGYVKRFCMSDAPWRGDCWMLDEGQDWSDALLSAFKKHAKVSIRAGDPFQRVYQWRGASSRPWIDPQVEHEFWLTQSFRTGTGSEELINQRLKALGSSHLWAGFPGYPCTVSSVDETVAHIQSFAPTAILASSWNVLLDLKGLLDQQGILNGLMKDGAILNPGTVVLSTIHAAKGLEFDRVWICDDALPQYEPQDIRHALAYVALTRAKHAVRVPSDWISLHEAHDVASNWAAVSGMSDAFE